MGPKTARKFLEQFGSLEGLLGGVARLKSAKQQEKIRAHADVARLSRDLVRLDDQVPIENRLGCRPVRQYRCAGRAGVV